MAKSRWSDRGIETQHVMNFSTLTVSFMATYRVSVGTDFNQCGSRYIVDVSRKDLLRTHCGTLSAQPPNRPLSGVREGGGISAGVLPSSASGVTQSQIDGNESHGAVEMRRGGRCAA